MSIENLIKKFRLEPHPEGGWFRRVFAENLTVAPGDGRGNRLALTAIYFLLEAGQLTRWHRVQSAEAWSLLDGGPLLLATFDAGAKKFTEHTLANADNPDGEPFHVIHAGLWQAALAPAGYAFASCAVGPGFEWADFAWLSDDPAALKAFSSAAPSRWRPGENSEKIGAPAVPSPPPRS